MKKSLLYALLIAIVGTPLLAEPQPDPLGEALSNSVESAQKSNTEAIKKNHRVDFTISEKLTNNRNGETYGPYEADIACKAYALDKQWLILAGKCMDYYYGDIYNEGDRTYIKRHSRKLLASDPAITNYAWNNNVMLIKTEKTFEGPFVKILATDSPEKLFTLSATHKVKIHTARMGINGVRERKLKTGSIDGNTFKLDEGWGDLSGTATDPLFLIAPNGHEYLTAYNNGGISYSLHLDFDSTFSLVGSDGKASPRWYSLEKEDLEFIKTTISQKDPNAWKTIKPRLFFNQTTKPYFQ